MTFFETMAEETRLCAYAFESDDQSYNCEDSNGNPANDGRRLLLRCSGDSNGVRHRHPMRSLLRNEMLGGPHEGGWDHQHLRKKMEKVLFYLGVQQESHVQTRRQP